VREEQIGGVIRGFMEACGVQPKVLAALSGLDPATISRELGGLKEIKPHRAFQYGVAIGKAVGRQRV
jgi:chaperonin GroEL (HSP60 family)